jgi:prepilin-type N-terminal cleavage/methylation domain-containing protein
MRSEPRHVSRRRSRAGFTIVEVIVAILVLTVGVLGFAGSAAIVTRMMASAEVQSDAANIASARFERLRGGRCPVANGTMTADNITERWAGVQMGGANHRMYEVVDTVQFTRRGVQRQQAYRSVVKCLP